MILEIEAASVRFGAVEAVRNISLGIEAGETVALSGPNGAGKSTLLNAIAGIAALSEGSISLDGRRLDGISADRRAWDGIGHCPERQGTFSSLSVRDNLRLGGYSLSEGESRVRQAMMYDLFPRLRDRKTQVSATLSGGERQMLTLARALMMGPRLLLLDEPSQGLAPQVADELFIALGRMTCEEHLTLLLVEQRTKHPSLPAGRCYSMFAGELVDAPGQSDRSI